ncbi:RES family NAD+ phosphorylase [Pseudoxanthomonas winnipegensis]|uniref:RES family NAD+ phosphorylase n=1 Tax=Pseudoxanthomonas winnipegensis TaxID=2480810 RepID=UPI0025791F8F|nr:RES family NAD+ phosphorylase [Pseudoxanthomonas winnipegensis]WJI14770.1 RES family NAD+ phosphorylase [Pseudoxanthomonas winnipegensis]
MLVYRISAEQHVGTALAGIGAARYGGRWNSLGVHVAYAAESTALAMLEVLVHMNLDMVPEGQRLLTFAIPDDAVVDLPRDQWPNGWRSLPYDPAVRAVGDAFIAGRQHLALRVPSAIAQGASNFLINPAHPRIGQVELERNDPLALDSRLFRFGPSAS